MLSKKSLWKPGLVATAVAGLLCGTMAHTDAADYFGAGTTYMQRGDYRSALGYLGQAYRTDSNNPEIAKMMSICYSHLHDNASARKWHDCWETIMRARAGGGSSASGAGQQRTVMSVQSSNLYAPATDLARLPEQCRVPFEREQGLIFITATLNNRPQRMIFDTGAEIVAVGKNHLRELGMSMPTGKPYGQAMGVGSNAGVNVWQVPMSVKVGSIERTNFTVMVQETMPTPPLLGQSFFRDFEYTIDSNSNDRDRGNICFTKKGSSLASASKSQASGYAVPFEREGNELVVKVAINGRPYPMYFDTGAAGCTFTDTQLRELNISIPADAVEEQHMGIGGTSSGHGFNVQSMRLGPIEKRDMPISVTHAAQMKHPLLGQTFYGDWQYTIDNVNNVIHFVRR